VKKRSPLFPVSRQPRQSHPALQKSNVSLANPIMAENEVRFVCNNCGQAFTTFLRDMAEHNARVVCPRCGASQDPRDAISLTDESNAKEKRSG